MYYGSVAWANDMLRLGIKICKGEYSLRILKCRIRELYIYVRMLKEFGYWWQIKALRGWLKWMKRRHGEYYEVLEWASAHQGEWRRVLEKEVVDSGSR